MAQLNHPEAVAVDGSGNVYIADLGNHRIRKLTAATGFITTLAGTGTVGYSPDGEPATATQINQPVDIALDSSGNVFFVDWTSPRIRKITSATGVVSTIAGTEASGFSGDGGAAAAAKLRQPYHVAIDNTGNWYITDYEDDRVRKVTAATGFISTIAGTGADGFSGDGGAATAAKLKFPEDIAVDGIGNLYITDNGRIRKITAATGVISTFAGTGTVGFSGDGGAATAAQLDWPTSVALDGLGNLDVADHNNYRIRKIGGFAGVEGIAHAAVVAAYPNPTTGVFVLEISELRAGATILVTDVAGNIRATKTVLRSELPTVILDLSGFTKGMYLVQVRDRELNCRTKVVVQ